MQTKSVEITALGAKGDGIAQDGSFVPFALPGELVETGADGAVLSIKRPSPHRITPICQHFCRCGGCALQHLDTAVYLDWKRQQVIDAFSASGLAPEVAPCLPVTMASRRRAVFSAVTEQDQVKFGFQSRHSHDVVDIKECPVLEPAISGKIAQLRQLAGIFRAGAAQLRVTVLASENGLDIAVDTAGDVGERRRKLAVEWAVQAKITRLSVNGEVAVQRAQPFLTIGEATVSPPPGGFVQAVRGAETQMSKLVAGHLKKSRRIVDLFSGYGAISLPLAARASVHAVELEQPALDALETVAASMTSIKKITQERRDLFHRPLRAPVLNKFDGALFDPPRAGAEEQASELAKSTITRLAAISCNPKTLARDAKILVDGGFRVSSLTPIDQFVYSPHVEVVALFERAKVKPKRRMFG